MGETKTISSASQPHTRESLADDFQRIGLQAGMTVMVHSSLSSLGWVCGGAVCVVQALMDVITNQGNIVMPAHTAYNSDPALWKNPPVPESWWQLIRDHTPAFDKNISPTRGLGVIAECFRNFAAVERSNHPMVSFTAWGSDAQSLTKDHRLEDPFGNSSPLGKLYQRDAYILLLGTGHATNTSLHLAENRIEGFPTCQQGSAVIDTNGKRVWKSYVDIEPALGDDIFANIGADYEALNNYQPTIIGQAQVRLMKQAPLVDFAQAYLSKKLSQSQST